MAAGSHSPTAPLPHHVPQVGQDHEAGDENNDPQHGAGRQDEGLLQGHQPPRQMGPHGDWREIQGLVSNATLLSNLLLLPPAPPPGARPQQHILGPGGGWVGPRPFGCRPGPIFLPGFLIPASGFGGDPPSASPLPPPCSVRSTVLKCHFPTVIATPGRGMEGWCCHSLHPTLTPTQPQAPITPV